MKNNNYIYEKPITYIIIAMIFSIASFFLAFYLDSDWNKYIEIAEPKSAELIKKWNISRDKLFMIGDKKTDKDAAISSNINFEYVENDLFLFLYTISFSVISSEINELSPRDKTSFCCCLSSLRQLLAKCNNSSKSR